MTSNEDAEIRKKVYKPLKRGSPTPLYYPLVRAKQRKCERRAVRRRVRLLGHIRTAPGVVLMPPTCVRHSTRP